MIKKFEDILISILDKKKIPGWRDIAIKKIGYEIFKEQFSHMEKEYDKFYARIEANEDKMEKFDHAIRFYYFWMRQPADDALLKPEFKLIVMFSIIEYLMSDEKFIPLNSWLLSEMKKGQLKITTKQELDTILEKYYTTYGSKRKVAKFFKDHYKKEDIDTLMKSLKTWDKTGKNFVEIKDIEKFINFVEGIRNLVIHRATYIQIGSKKDYDAAAEGMTSYSSETLTLVNGKSYTIDNSTMHIESLLEGFEKGIINYFS